MATTAKTELLELQAFREQMDPLDLLEMQDQSAHKDQKGTLEHKDLQENRASDPTGSMEFQAQTGCQVNLEKSEHLEREGREAQLVSLVLLELGALRLCIRARSCVLTPVPPVCMDILVSPV